MRKNKEDIKNIWVDEKGKPYKACGKLDYVSCWYFKAAQYIQKTSIRAAFVSTNSIITQGEQVAGVWKPIMERFGIHIDFAGRTFRLDSEASAKAHVHVVIIGFSDVRTALNKKLFEADGSFILVDNINPYLINGPTVFIESRNKLLPMTTGNRSADGGNLLIQTDEYKEFIAKEPDAVPYIKNLTGSAEFINGKKDIAYGSLVYRPMS